MIGGPQGQALPPPDAPPEAAAAIARTDADAMSNALALVRTLLSTAPPPAVEYNVPVVDVQRYAVTYFMLLYLHSRRSHIVVGSWY
jgi:hypothetical protein